MGRPAGVSWNTAGVAVRSAVGYSLGRRDAASVIARGTDEISRRKGHKYMTMVCGLSGMRLLWRSEGGDRAAWRAFPDDWGEELRGQAEAACLGM